MENELAQTVSVRFNGCESGWIRFAVSVAGQSVNIQASHFYDPFPNLLSWMDAILTGVQQCSFVIDEEGLGKEFVAARKRGGRLLFIVRDPEDQEEFIRADVARRQLIECFYSGMKAFAGSSQYHPEEWQLATLNDCLRALLPGLDDGQIIDRLIRLNRDELKRILFRASPSYQISFPEEPTKGDEIARFADYIEDENNPKNKEGMVSTPDEWEIPSEYDTWKSEERTQFVLTLLREPANSWNGCKLAELESPSIERYLLNSQPDDKSE